MKKTVKYCAYCGKQASTRDHIPPASFFPKPRPDGLITVPCCRSCNEAFGLDDEYVKIIIALRDDIGNHPEGRKLIESVFRALERKEAQGFKSQISESLKRAEIQSKSGLFLGYRDILNLDKDRLSAFVERMARGLFFHVFTQPIPDDFNLTPAPLLEVNLDTLRKLASMIDKSTIQTVGNAVFRFGWSEAPDSPMTSIWYMEFFETVPFGAIITNTNAPNNNGSGLITNQ